MVGDNQSTSASVYRNVRKLLIPFFLIALVSCQQEPLQINCDAPYTLVDQDHTYWICGGNYQFVSSDEQDTLRIQYNDILRDFFVNEGIQLEDFPVAVNISFAELPADQTCREWLKELTCITLRN